MFNFVNPFKKKSRSVLNEEPVARMVRGTKRIMITPQWLEAEMIKSDHEKATFDIWDVETGWYDEPVVVPIANSDAEYKELLKTALEGLV